MTPVVFCTNASEVVEEWCPCHDDGSLLVFAFIYSSEIRLCSVRDSDPAMDLSISLITELTSVVLSGYPKI